MERLLGAKYPISLGTACVLENKDFDMRKWPNLLYVNLRTLYRNYVQSYHRNDYNKIKEMPFMDAYLEEVANFESIIRQLSNQRIRVFFYYPTYSKLKKVLPSTVLKDFTKCGFDEIEDNMWAYVKKHGLMTPFLYKTIDQELPRSNETVLVLTSFVIDLLSAPNFPTLLLLESFTGRIKKRAEWGSKINVGGDRNKRLLLPFNPFTIQIFGDKSGALKGADARLRKVVRELAETNHWSPITNMSKIKTAVSMLKDPEIKKQLMKYL